MLVNNASTFERDEWDDATRESWDRHLEPNLRAPFVLAQAIARALPAAAEGVVVNMLDQRVWSLTPHFVSYTVSKAGLWALTQSLALALAPRIRVNGIGPGPALPSTAPDAGAVRRGNAPPCRCGTAPGRRRWRGRVLAILALPAMTGQMIALDGGQHLQWAPAACRGAAECGRMMDFAPDADGGLRLVFVRGLALQARLGVHPHEKAAPQRVVIGVELAVEDDAAPAASAPTTCAGWWITAAWCTPPGPPPRTAIPCWWKPWPSGSPWRRWPTRG